jgi:tetratricopeptide (TPR) repeat protein
VNEKAMEWMVRAKQEDTPDFKELMARTLFGLGKYQDSARLFNELIDVNPFSTRYWNELASAQFMNEDYSNSVQSSEFSIAIDPENPEGIISKANGLYRLENYEEALNYFRRYSELVPEDEFALLHQGTCLINLARNEEAHQMLLQAIEVAPEDSPYLCDIYQELAFVLSEEGKTDEAMEYINKTDDLDCDHIQMLIVKGHIALAGHRKEESENYFHQAIQDSDYSLNVIMRVCVSLYENHYVAGAYSLFQQLFSGAPEEFDEGFAYMALCCYELKKNEEFLHFLEIACKRNPKECKMVLSDLFPKDLAPELYYDYIKNQQK